ncbi:MAG: glycosyltransferase family 4 protein [Acidobacteriota bacterium]
MKTAHITNYYHKTSGGIRTFYLQMMEYAGRHQRNMFLIVPGEKDEVEIVNDYAKIYYVSAMKSPLFDTRYRIIMPWQFMSHGTRIREILLEEKPDMIEICDKYLISFMAAMIRKHAFSKLGRPMLVHFSCERMDVNIDAFLTHSKIGNWFARRMMGNYNVSLYDFFIAVSPYIAEEYFAATLEKNNPKRSKAFFNWCWRFFRGTKLPLEDRVFWNLRTGPDPLFSTDNYSEEFKKSIREEVGIPQDSKIIFYAGRLSPEKNIEVLVEMMKVLRQDKTNDYRMLVAGDGPKKDWFVEQFRQMPDVLKMLGHITDKQKLANLYASCEVFVHPNPREPSGNGVLEAMASGAPVVAPNSGGILTYANTDNAWLVEPTGENFANAVRDILTNEEKRKEKTANAVQTAKENNREKILGEVFELYEKMFERFQSENDKFNYREKAKDFDFAENIGK